MDAQMKRGTLEICVLSTLLKGESYGYKISKDLDDIVGISESTLYPILKRLEQNKLVTSHSEEYNGRLRKFYKITDNGYKKILEYLEDFNELIKVYKYIKKGVKENER